MHCPNCGTKNNNKAKYCLNCGQKIKQKSAKDKKRKNFIFLAIISLFLIIGIIMGKQIYDKKVSGEETASVFKNEENEEEKREKILAEADKEVENKEYHLAAANLEKALMIKQDESTETLKKLVEKLEQVSQLYEAGKFGKAYDEVSTILLRTESRKGFRSIYIKAEELKEEIKESHQSKWDKILSKDREMDFDQQNSLLDYEYVLETPEYFDESDLGWATNELYTYLNNDFVERNLFDDHSSDEELSDGIYLFYNREEKGSIEIVEYAEKVAALGFPVKFYSSQRDQTIAGLANKISVIGDNDYFSEDEDYYLIVKGSDFNDSDSPYLTKRSVNGSINYLKEVIEKEAY